MKTRASILLIVASASILMAEPAVRGLMIRDDGPAVGWDHSYPVGNGRLGAMPQGRFPSEKILINEETIWENIRSDMKIPGETSRHLEIIRELDEKGDHIAADRHYMENLVDGSQPNSYQLVGWLDLLYRDAAEIAGTRRELDLTTGVARSEFTLGDGNRITQDVLASAPDDVIIITITAEKPVSLDVSMKGGGVEAGDLVLRGKGGGQLGTRYISRVRARADSPVGGTKIALEIRAARSITLLLGVATNFNRENPDQPLADGWEKAADVTLDNVESRRVEALHTAAIGDHRKYFNRMDVDFGITADEILALPTSARIQRIRQGSQDDPDLIETYFQFGRYLLIGSSRPGCLPANLQGIWNPHLNAPWSSDYHLNINLQMNYWLAESTNLPEMHRPLIGLIRQFQPRGREMAARMGMKGWAMGHSTDVWGHAKPMGRRVRHTASYLSGQWLTFHILDHYRFNRDKQVLAENWDILTAATEFAEGWLIPGPDGTLISRPSSSPENDFLHPDAEGKLQPTALSSGISYDQSMILEVFRNYLEAAVALGKSSDPYVMKIAGIIPRVYRPGIGGDGRLMEWRMPFAESEPGHRHISHLLGAFPGSLINLDDDPQMREAVIKSLEFRLDHGGARTGWSRAWTICMFARLGDSQRAFDNLHAMLGKSTLPNLWDTHPPFQIDGNFGATAGIAEMLLHSHNKEIKLLPALPAARWPDGHVRGLRARGDHTVDIEWKNGKLTAATLHAGPNSSGRVKMVYGDRSIELEAESGESISIPVGKF